ncbi:hypothetical protein [Methylobacterium soli]|uniref:DUF2946 domain-containing protein n=1 Tax=Methylobacterium soli TaxID=553447 RepID=A0A6L3T3H0_9HYPH|nr:hypothetical protein [Methylobacterium soli]KAB1081377.1 hypothetical protein F6X53_03455 [Methylobacterium soli]GJE45395.1 hypothetical protein AEGHOMDF_4589 [Methylobacterium soli]
MRLDAIRRDAGLGWRSAVRLVALLMVLALGIPASEGRADLQAAHPGAAHLSLDMDRTGPGDHADGGLAHHCAHCACHQAIATTPQISLAPRSAAAIRFAERTDPDAPGATIPPRKPPRA